MSTSSTRVGGIAGLAFVGLVLSVNIIQGAAHAPMAGASRSDVLDYYATSGIATSVGTALAPLVWLALVLFAGGVVAALRRHEQLTGDTWSLVGLVGAVMQNALFAGVIATNAAMATGSLSDDATWGLWQLHNAFFHLNTMSLAIVLLAVSIGAGRAGIIRRWQRTLGLVGGAGMTVAAVTTPAALDGHRVGLIGFAAFMLWLVWVGAVSTRLLRLPAPAPSSNADVASPALAGAR